MDTSVQPLYRTLPGRYYTDPDIFRGELDTFYIDGWVWAGRAEWLASPGSYCLREVAGESILIVRDEAATLRAFFNVCRHRGTRLCSGPEGLLEGRIQCPYHGWNYSLSGTLLGAPHMSVAFDRRDYPLNPVALALWDGHIFLNLSNSAPELSDNLSPLIRKFAPWGMSDLQLHRRLSYHVRANWKLLISNYNECLHCPLLHPTLNQLTDYLGADNEPASPHYVGGAMGFRNGAETMSIGGGRPRAYLPGLSEGERRQVQYYAIYPNFLLSLHPDYMLVHSLWPQSVDRTTVHCEFYFHPSELAQPNFDASDATEFWDRTNREDWRIVEQSQLGVSSRAYTPGPYSPREELLHSFDVEVLRRESAR